jgi:hypothetical protein
MTPAELSEKLAELEIRVAAIDARRAALVRDLRAKKAELASLVAAIKASGYAPVERTHEPPASLDDEIREFERHLADAELMLRRR